MPGLLDSEGALTRPPEASSDPESGLVECIGQAHDAMKEVTSYLGSAGFKNILTFIMAALGLVAQGWWCVQGGASIQTHTRERR